MYRICKVLNHNGVIALDMNDSKEYVLLGKGVGFGKKPGERFEQPADCTVYSLQETSSRGDAAELIKSIQPEYFQMANRILNEAERHFGKIVSDGRSYRICRPASAEGREDLQSAD